MYDTGKWKVVNEAVGHLGKRRDDIVRNNNEEYGFGNWGFGWVVELAKRYFYLTFEEAILLYEDSYYNYERDPSLSFPPDWVMKVAQYKEVYDNAVTNVESGVRYSVQETSSNHYQDVSVRRVLLRYGYWFTGKKSELLHLRHNSHQVLGRKLSPGRVPFHLPRILRQPQLKGWWEADTVESFWQSNKCLLVRS